MTDRSVALRLSLVALALGCGACTITDLPEGCDRLVEPGGDDQEALQTAFIDAAGGGTVCIAAGDFSFTRQLSLTDDGVTVKGAGPDETVLDFSGQISGANGILIEGDGITFRDLHVKNTPGDGIRGNQVEDIAFERVTVTWDADASLENGAYGLYPVQANGVTIRNCVVKGARDAGIYVGQSTDILVEDSEAHGNVAGIEIENSTEAIVRRNHAHDNAAGILVFNLPGLDVKDGRRANLYENIVENNNTPNFAEAGTVVAMVPPGVGFLVLAADQNELHANTIQNNKSVGVGVISYLEVLFGAPNDPGYDIFSEGNFIHDNTFLNNGYEPELLVLNLTMNTMPTPDVVFDGCFDPAKGNGTGEVANCLSNNGAATYLGAQCLNGMPPTMDIAAVTCTHEPLPTEPVAQ